MSDDKRHLIGQPTFTTLPPVVDVPEPTDLGPLDPYAARIGDLVSVTIDGRTYTMTVSRVYDDSSIGSANSRTVIAHIRPGGYSVALRPDNIGPKTPGAVGARYNARRLSQ